MRVMQRVCQFSPRAAATEYQIISYKHQQYMFSETYTTDWSRQVDHLDRGMM